MAPPPSHKPGKRRGPPLLLWIGLAVLVLGGGGWYLLTGVEGVERVAAGPPTIQFVPPPPPPPPPPEPEEQPPEPVEEETPTPEPDPTPQPEPAEAPQAVTMDAAGEAGGDAFGIQAGSGKGMGAPSSAGTGDGPAPGGGVADGFYKRYLRDVLQEAARANDDIRRKVFRAELRIWITGGRVSQAEVVQTTDAGLNEDLIEAFKAVRDIDSPPATIRFPQRVVVTGRQ